MPVTRAQNAQMQNAAATLIALKYSKAATGFPKYGKAVAKDEVRPVRKAAIMARLLISMCAASDNE